jgi:hypothetical protein
VFGGIFGCDFCSSEFLTPYQVDINFISGLLELIQNYFIYAKKPFIIDIWYLGIH